MERDCRKINDYNPKNLSPTIRGKLKDIKHNAESEKFEEPEGRREWRKLVEKDKINERLYDGRRRIYL